jgi:hypothetical protein
MHELYPKLTKEEQEKVDFIQNHIHENNLNVHSAVPPETVPQSVISAIDRQYNKMRKGHDMGIVESYKKANVNDYYATLPTKYKEKVDSINTMRATARTGSPNSKKSSRR